MPTNPAKAIIRLHGRLQSILAIAFVAIFSTVGFAEDASVKPAARASHQPITVKKNERYSAAEGKAGLCDLYLPGGDPPPGGFPAVIVIHGGGWVSGDKWTVFSYSNLLAQNGFAVIVSNYRLAPKFKFPSQVDDVRQVLLWTKENAKRFSIDMKRLGMFGYSAGGHLVTMVSGLADEPMKKRLMTSDWKAEDPKWKELPQIQAVCAGGPPCDFRSFPIDGIGMTFFLGDTRRAKPEIYDVASPTTHASAGDPTTLIIHGDRDALVPMISSQSLYNALKKAGIDVRYKTMPNQGHMATFLNSGTRQAMLEFFQETLAPQDQ